MKACKVCGQIPSKLYGDVCRKHYLQFKRHGKYLTRTIYDPNKFIINNDYIDIELYDIRGNIVGYAQVDIDDFDKVKDRKWYLRKGYVATTINGEKHFLHRIICNPNRDKFVDHINGNKSDCRKLNLRICTKQENTRHRINRQKIAGIKQVPSGKYQAIITVNYKPIYLGSFLNEEDAIKARLDAEIKYFKDFRVK